MPMIFSRQSMIAFLLSIIIGATCGALLILWDESIRGDDLPDFFMLLFWVALISLPYVCAGLALLGLPVTWLLHRYVMRPWFGLVAVGWGWMAGSIIYYWYDRIRWDGSNELAQVTGIQDLGPVYGIPTGLAWWLLYLRAVRARHDDTSR